MILPKVASALRGGGKIVGAIYSLRGLRLAARLNPGAVDFLELRADMFADEIAQVARLVPRLKIPLILTVRDRREGGAGELSTVQRIALYEKFLRHAALVDIELASLKELAPVIAAARARKVGLIFSHHDFQKTPPKAKLLALAGRAVREGADVFKIAALAPNASDMAALLAFLAAEKRVPVSVMGMGRFGKVSRLLFTQAGSVLNYGFLDKAAVAGQWPAALLKKRLGELEP
jgi:3-dehydroquinate dehydratase type I